jgi:small subunit ribosomal protein S18
MTSKKNKARQARESTRKFKKKPDPIAADKVEYIDYKDVNLLQRFVTDRSKIRGRRLVGTTVQDQRELATAIKNAREMALLPYTKRTTSTRAPRGERREDGDGEGRRGPDRRGADREAAFEENAPAMPTDADAPDDVAGDYATEEQEA